MKYYVVPLLFLCLTACKKNTADPAQKPENAKSIGSFKHTAFVATPGESIPNDKNAIYGAAFLLAWQQLKDVANGQVSVGADNPELQRLNASQAYKNTLNKEEYTATNNIDIEMGRVSVSAQYSKSLPLTDDLMAFKNKLVFNGTKVASFGGENYDWHKAYNSVNTIL